MKTNWRWWMCGLLFAATTINYLDRQVLSLTAKEFIFPEFHWTDNDYGTITAFFSVFYALCSLFVGKVVDVMGTRKAYLWAIFIWSLAACMHALCGVGVQWILGYESLEAMRMVENGSAAALAISTVGVWAFIFCRGLLAIGESGNFPAAIRVTTEYFPKKDRAYATSVFNAGASIGACVAPLTIPHLAAACGWEMSFVIIGVLGFFWMGFFVKWYDEPEQSAHVNEEELAYIHMDDADEASMSNSLDSSTDLKPMSFLKVLSFRQTWAFAAGKFFSDGVWWFLLFWAPAYFQDVYGYKASSGVGSMLIFTLYVIVTVLSIFLCRLPNFFVEKRGMEPYSGRMKAMLIIAFIPLVGLVAQWSGQFSAWWPAVVIGIVGAGHQAWSANVYSIVGDMFPKNAVATVVGIGTMAGGLCSFAINKFSGMFFDWAGEQGSAFCCFGLEGKPAAYMIVFCYCAIAYLVAWCVIKMLVPRYKKITI